MTMPEALRCLPWHSEVWAGLEARLKAGRLPHAVLFGGPPGIGKMRLALRLAAAILCGGAATARPCGRCDACRWVAQEEHPDLILCQPETGKAVIRIDAVRGLIDELALAAHRGLAKVALLAPAEAMNVHAANSLLKTLEEPPPGTHLILVSHQPGRLPATVRSRCQRLPLSPPPRETARRWLHEQGVPESATEALLARAGGAPLRALSWSGEGAREAWQALWTALEQVARQPAEAMAVAEAWAQAEDLEDRLQWWGQGLCLLRRRQVGDEAAPLPPVLARMTALDPLRLHRFAQRLEALRGQLTTALNLSLQLADVLLQWHRLVRSTERRSA